jgi:rhamnosyltransferase
MEFIIKNSKPKVLVLLAVYNGNSWLDEQINSIFKQEGTSLELVISDDNSNDGSQVYLKNLIKKKPHLKITFKKKGSGSAGQNFLSLIRNCNPFGYDYIAFSDQDDVWLENKLSAGIECIENASACGYSSSTQAFWKSGKEKLITQSKEIRELDFLFEGAGQGCTFILKHDFFSYVQKFCIDNESITEKFYYHDWLVYILARSNGNDWFFDDRSFIRYRQHASNDTGARGSVGALKSRLSLIANGWYKRQIKVALEISKSSIESKSDTQEFEKIFYKSDSLRRRLLLVRFFISNGRRKTSDRIVLVLSSLLGWI